VSYLLDSNAWIGWLRNSQPKLVARIAQEDPADLRLCSVVLGELLYGAERASPAYRASNLQAVTLIRARFVSLPFDDSAAEEYGKLRAHLAAAGQPIGPTDMMIAAIALANGLTVVTHNTAEFGRVPGLAVEDWQ
jgi:tRNA(fMet)-specific endonuclease VapC